MLEINLLLLFMIASAIIAVEVKDLLSSVVAIGAVGIGLCMAFLALKAPDLAMLQLVVEILCLIILIRATIRTDIPFSTSGRWLFNTICTIIFLAVFLVCAGSVLKSLPQFGRPLMASSGIYLDKAFIGSSAKNCVSAIALKYRSLDTLGEIALMFTVIIGVLAVARKTAKKKQ